MGRKIQGLYQGIVSAMPRVPRNHAAYSNTPKTFVFLSGARGLPP
jgi:hypothetical protein